MLLQQAASQRSSIKGSAIPILLVAQGDTGNEVATVAAIIIIDRELYNIACLQQILVPVMLLCYIPVTCSHDSLGANSYLRLLLAVHGGHRSLSAAAVASRLLHVTQPSTQLRVPILSTEERRSSQALPAVAMQAKQIHTANSLYAQLDALCLEYNSTQDKLERKC